VTFQIQGSLCGGACSSLLTIPGRFVARVVAMLGLSSGAPTHAVACAVLWSARGADGRCALQLAVPPGEQGGWSVRARSRCPCDELALSPRCHCGRVCGHVWPLVALPHAPQAPQAPLHLRTRPAWAARAARQSGFWHAAAGSCCWPPHSAAYSTLLPSPRRFRCPGCLLHLCLGQASHGAPVVAVPLLFRCRHRSSAEPCSRSASSCLAWSCVAAV
jgi:hypothetical protein